MAKVKEFGRKFVEVFNYGSSISQGWIRENGQLPNSYSVTTFRSIKDIDENSVKTLQEVALVIPKETKWLGLSSTVIQGSGKSVMTELSKSSRYRVSFYNSGVGTAGTKKEQGSFVEVIDDKRGSYRLDTSSIHGKVIGDSWFGGCSWSSDEQFVIYVAQILESTATSSTRKTVIEKLSEKEDKEEQSFRNKFDYIEDWGEKYVDVSELGLFVLDIAAKKICAIPMDVAKDYTLGQPIFIDSPTTDQYAIAFTAWDIKPRRLGMIYCYQRASSIWVADITNLLTKQSETAPISCWKVSSNVQIARSPRSSPSGKTLLFVGNRKGFLSHNGCAELLSVDLSSFWNQPSHGDAQVIIPEVRNPKDHPQTFPGLFLDNLPKSCFLSEEEILITSLWGSCETILRISLTQPPNSSCITPLCFWEKDFEDWKDSSISILDVSANGEYLLAQISNPIIPAQVFVWKLSSNPPEVVFGSGPMSHSVTTKYLPTSPLTSPFPNLHWQIFRHETDGIPFNSIFLSPKSSAALPVIVVPHGGPHSCLTNTFIAAYVYLIEMLQIGILFINYRGSTGFGQESIESLLGNIGRNDVADIMTALYHLLTLQTPIIVDANRIGIIGGSHGGFLSAHMCGQYPEVFKVCCLRNPVTNIPAMASVTDIPDWCHVEAGTQSQDITRGGMTDEELSAMRKASPIAHINTYRTPTLLCLGAKDRRVPVSQGIEFYHLLQARNIPSRMMIFPEDVHAIDSPTAESEHWIAIAQWIATYL